MPTDFFKSQYGNYMDLPFWRKREAGRLTDLLFSLRLYLNRSFRTMEQRLANQPRQNILIMGVDVPARSSDLTNVMAAMSSNRHTVTRKAAHLFEGKGKFENINLALKEVDVERYDWLIVVDDDISLPGNFLDHFIGLANLADLKICQPAHNFFSYQSYAITQRQWNSLVRETHYVESGPVTAFHRDMFADLLPFAPMRWAWGTDVAWSERARRNGYKIGIVDGTPIGHLRPVAASYDSRTAREEADAFLETEGVDRSRHDILQTQRVYCSIPSQRIPG